MGGYEFYRKASMTTHALRATFFEGYGHVMSP